MLRALVVAIGLALAACGGVSARGLVAERGPDGAAEELRLRLVRDPRDVALWTALAEVEEQRGRPGAAIAALERAERLGRPFRGGLDAWPRARFAALYLARARVRAERDSPGAEPDLERARALGGAIDPAVEHRAGLAAIAADLRHSDPDRRARGLARLHAQHPTLAAGLAPDATPADVERTTAWLVAIGARRLAFETLDRIADRAAATATATTGTLPPWPAATVERWLTLRRWWSGTGDPIDRLTLDQARSIGASICAYERWPAYPACDPHDADRARTAIDAAPRGHASSEWAVIAAAAAAAGPSPDAPDRDAPDRDALADIARAYARDPALADRRAEDLAATAIDAAVIAPVVGRLFAALGDPARARAWWERAYEASPEEVPLVMGLAIAMAEAGDGPAGLQLVWRAAAASGDAPRTFYRAARGFAAAGRTLDALSLARTAIEQSAPGDEAPPAGLAAALLRELGRERAAAEVGAMAARPGDWDLGPVRAQAAALAGQGTAGVDALLGMAASADPAAVQAALAALRSVAARPASARTDRDEIVRESPATPGGSGLP